MQAMSCSCCTHSLWSMHAHTRCGTCMHTLVVVHACTLPYIDWELASGYRAWTTTVRWPACGYSGRTTVLYQFSMAFKIPGSPP